MKVLSEAAEKRRVVEIEYLKEGDEQPVRPPCRAVHDRARAAGMARAHVGSDRRRAPARSGSTACAPRGSPTSSFEPRDGFDPSYLRNPRVARLHHSPVIARWKLERGARPLTDGSAIADVPYKTEEWLLSEVLADRGETVVLEPQRLRDVVAKRARRLQREAGSRPHAALTVTQVCAESVPKSARSRSAPSSRALPLSHTTTKEREWTDPHSRAKLAGAAGSSLGALAGMVTVVLAGTALAHRVDQPSARSRCSKRPTFLLC